jgi:hypothetical protein
MAAPPGVLRRHPPSQLTRATARSECNHPPTPRYHPRVTSLVWRSLITLPLPLALAGCPGDDPTPADDGLETTSAADSSSSGAGSSVGPDDTTTTGVADSSTGGTTAVATTEPESSSSGPVAETGDSTTGVISVCGNNVIEGDEVCDLAQVNGETCQSLGYQGGQLGCLLTCTEYNLLGCFICGNEVVDIAEDCEGTVPEDLDCEALGYQAGEVTCGADCLYDTTECSICGDGIQQGPEACDGIDYGGNTCQSIGFDEGTLGCNLASCTYNVSGCSGGQYTQDFEVGVMPPEFTVGGNVAFTVDGTMPIAGGFSAHNGDIGDNQSSTMSLTASFAAAGTISFWHRESTEACCDFLQFRVDGVQVMQWSGQAGVAAQFNHNVGAGMHTIEWVYDKDVSLSPGSDTVWVDDIQLIPGVPI